MIHFTRADSFKLEKMHDPTIRKPHIDIVQDGQSKFNNFFMGQKKNEQVNCVPQLTKFKSI